MQGTRLALVLGCLAAVGCEGDGIRYRGGVDPTGTGVGTGTGTGTGTTNNNIGLLGSCDRADLDGSCIGYMGVDWTEPDAVADCNDGTYTSGAQCALNDTLGFCVTNQGTTIELWTFYYDGAFYTDADVPSLQSACDVNGGSWTN